MTDLVIRELFFFKVISHLTMSKEEPHRKNSGSFTRERRCTLYKYKWFQLILVYTVHTSIWCFYNKKTKTFRCVTSQDCHTTVFLAHCFLCRNAYWSTPRQYIGTFIVFNLREWSSGLSPGKRYYSLCGRYCTLLLIQKRQWSWTSHQCWLGDSVWVVL